MPNQKQKFFKLLMPMTLVLVLFGVFFLVSGVSAQLDLGLGFGSNIGLSAADPRAIAAQIIRIALSFLGILAVGLVLYAGFLWMTSGGNEEKVNKAKKILIGAVIGLIIILAAWGIAYFVLNKLIGATGGNINGWEECPEGMVRCPDGICRADCGDWESKNLLVKSISPQGEVRICNPVVRITFNKRVDPTTVEGNITVSANNQQIAGTLKVEGALVEFRPSSDCSPPDNGKKCFQTNQDPDTEYTINIVNGVKGADGTNLWCGSGYPCNANFTILNGCTIDTKAPTVNLTYPYNGQTICQNGTPVKATAQDNGGVSRVDFYVDGNYLDSDAPTQGNTRNFAAEVWWDTAGLELLSVHKLFAKAFDIDDNSGQSNEVQVKIYPAHCCNEKKDADETDIDCGGQDCPACEGEDCDGADNNPDTCVQPDHWQCQSHYCARDCTCLALPLITSLDPDNGAPYNLITIWGEDFGQTSGQVSFLGDNNNESCRGLPPSAVNADCGRDGYWQDNQIIIAVPDCAKTGPLKVTTAEGLYDRTDDWRGWQGNFTVNNIVRPGVCKLNPSQGKLEDPFEIQGLNFGDNQGNVWFGHPLGNNKVKATTSSWSATIIGAIVPNVKPATVPVYVQETGGEISNGVNFIVKETGNGIISCGPKKDSVCQNPAICQQYNKSYFCDENCICRLPKEGEPCGDYNPETLKCDNKKECDTGLVCNDKCLCVKEGVVYCDNNSTPGCQEPNSTICKNNGYDYCDAKNCVCQKAQMCTYAWSFTAGEKTSCDGDANNPGCQADINLCDKGERCSVEDDCTCVSEGIVPPPENPEEIPCDQDKDFKNGCQMDKSLCPGDKPICNNNTCLCEEIKQCTYAWSFTTGSDFIVEECVLDDEKAPLPSPTPWFNWTGGKEACVNALVAARFSETVKDSSLRDDNNHARHPNVIIEECPNDSCPPIPCDQYSQTNCSNSWCTWNLDYNECRSASEVPGEVEVEPVMTGKKNSDGTDEMSEGFKFYPTGKTYKPATRYKVTLRGEEGGVTTDNNIPLIDDYSWEFKTKNSEDFCTVKSIKVSPSLAKLVANGAQQIYSADPLPDEDCQRLNDRLYTWDWRSKDEAKAKIKVPDPDGKDKDNTTAAEAIGETVPEPPVKIFAKIADENKEGYGQLIVDFTNFLVLEHWPGCGGKNNENVCINAAIGALFNRKVKEDSFTAGCDPNTGLCCDPQKDKNCQANIAVYSCPAGKCDNLNNIEQVKINYKDFNFFNYLDSGYEEFNIFPLDKDGKLIAPLNPNTYYLVIFRDGVYKNKGIKNYLNEGLDNSNYNIATGEECDADKPWPAYCDLFSCLNKGLLICTDTIKDNCCGNKIKEPGEDCDDGNILDGDGCSKKCLNEGSGSNFKYQCGNGNEDDGEDKGCDTKDKDGKVVINPGCNNNCLYKGSFSPALCGDGLVDKIHGEECDDKNQTNGDGCDNKCQYEGGCQPGAKGCDRKGLPACADPAKDKNCCGNNIKEAGEECDDGNTTNGDGCTSQCLYGECLHNTQGCDAEGLHAGTPPKVVCGNGKVEIGEDCDDGNTISGDGCKGIDSDNKPCTNEGSKGWAICGNGVIEDSAFDSYAWVFKTKNDAEFCKLANIDVKPEVATTTIGEIVNYQADAKGSPDECNPAGQKLNPYFYIWNWLTKNWAGLTTDSQAKIYITCNEVKNKNDSTTKNRCDGSYCLNDKGEQDKSLCLSNYCYDSLCRGSFTAKVLAQAETLPKEPARVEAKAQDKTDQGLLNISKGKTSGALCQINNEIYTYLNQGLPACADPAKDKNCCGNKIKEAGEECDDGNILNGDGCSNKCLNEGLSQPDNKICPYEVTGCDPYFSCLAGKANNKVCQSYEDCPRCCCKPGDKYKFDDSLELPDLVCEPDQKPCTCGNKESDDSDCGRGFYCGCVADQQCATAFNNQQGCGFQDPKKCCHSRPWVKDCNPTLEFTGTRSENDTWCLSGNEDFCPNGLIKVEFDQLMDAKSFAGNIKVVTKYTDKSECPEGTTDVGDFSLAFNNLDDNQGGFISRGLKALARGFNRLLGREARAQTEKICWVNGDLYAEDVGLKELAQTIATFVPEKVLDFNQEYGVVVFGDKDFTDGTAEGVKSAWGVGMNPNDIWNWPAGQKGSFNGQTYFYWSFKTKIDYCPIDHLEIKINDIITNSDLFNCAGEGCDKDQSTAAGNQHLYHVEAIDKDGNYLQVRKDESGKENYDWEEIDADGAISLSTVCDQKDKHPDWCDNDHYQYVTNSSLKDAYAYLNVSAEDYFKDQNGFYHKVEQLVDIRLFMCQNPWPSFYNFPWRDAEGNCTAGQGNCPNTNFEFYYCRDRGAAGEEDDLPPLASPAVIKGSGDNLKEFLFANNFLTKITVADVKDGIKYTSQSGSTDNELTTAEGWAYSTNNKAFWEYEFNFSTNGNYQAFAWTASSADLKNKGVSQTVNVYFDGVLKGTFTNWAMPVFQKGTVLLGTVTAGKHKVKYEWLKNQDPDIIISQVGVESGEKADDVIGFRVMANNGGSICSNNCQKPCATDTEEIDCPGGYCVESYAHLSPSLWYTTPCNVPEAGNPQNREIDGYKAVRDGRTSYVSAANCSLNNCNPDNEPGIAPTLYTNIYLVSYNEKANNDTINIYNQILDDWHFNVNMNNLRECRDKNGNLIEAAYCLNNLQCPDFLSNPEKAFCDAQKSKITRDTIRLGDLNDLDYLLDKYKEKNGGYPALESGSYIKGESTSKWPVSWNSTLANKLGSALPLDPLNIFNLPCQDDEYTNSFYEQSTCWSETKKDFYLKTYAKLYIYKYDAGEYNLCTDLEFCRVNNNCNWSKIGVNSSGWDDKHLKFDLQNCHKTPLILK